MPKSPQCKTGRRQLESPAKNCFIGAVQAMNNVSQACRDQNVLPSTGYDLWHKFQETGSTSNRPHSGCPTKVDKPLKQEVIQKALENRRKPLQQLGNEVEPNICQQAVRAILSKEGYHSRVAKKVPYLSKVMKAKFLAWA